MREGLAPLCLPDFGHCSPTPKGTEVFKLQPRTCLAVRPIPEYQSLLGCL